jgi:hypothetical protein
VPANTRCSGLRNRGEGSWGLISQDGEHALVEAEAAAFLALQAKHADELTVGEHRGGQLALERC